MSPMLFYDHPPARARRPSLSKEGISCACAQTAHYIEGGAASGALPQSGFGLGPIFNSSLPPLAISEWVNHGRFSGFPFSVAD